MSRKLKVYRIPVRSQPLNLVEARGSLPGTPIKHISACSSIPVDGTAYQSGQARWPIQTGNETIFWVVYGCSTTFRSTAAVPPTLNYVGCIWTGSSAAPVLPSACSNARKLTRSLGFRKMVASTAEIQRAADQ